MADFLSGGRRVSSLPGTGGRPVVTYALLAVNLLVWLMMEAAGGSKDQDVLLRFGALSSPRIADGDYWRLFTAMFLHLGIEHLLVNSLGLFIFGQLVERIYGPVRFALIYVLAGLFGSVASYHFINILATGAGASGAILGVMGAFAAFFLARRDVLGEVGRQNLMGILVIAGISLFFGLVTPGIDNWAHMGGFVSGFAIGFAFAPRYKAVDDVFGFGGRLVDSNSLARSWWVVPVAVAVLFAATTLGNSRIPDAQSHIESAQSHVLRGDDAAADKELRKAIEIAMRTGDAKAIAEALILMRALESRR